MKSQPKALVVGCLTALAGLALPATASATGVCYAFTEPGEFTTNTVDGGPPFVLRYLSTKVGALTTSTESTNFYHLRQDAYSLVGKVTALIEFACNGEAVEQCLASNNDQHQVRLMTTADGTIITGKVATPPGWSPDEPGAHMGVNVHLLRRVGELGITQPIGPAVLECTSSQASATPQSWRCNLRLDININAGAPFFYLPFALIGPFSLQKVNSNTTPACSVFQDGEPDIRPL